MPRTKLSRKDLGRAWSGGLERSSGEGGSLECARAQARVSRVMQQPGKSLPEDPQTVLGVRARRLGLPGKDLQARRNRGHAARSQHSAWDEAHDIRIAKYDPCGCTR